MQAPQLVLFDREMRNHSDGQSLLNYAVSGLVRAQKTTPRCRRELQPGRIPLSRSLASRVADLQCSNLNVTDLNVEDLSLIVSTILDSAMGPDKIQ